MKKGSSVFLLTALFAFVVIPQVTFAVWWKPTTWFGGWGFLSPNRAKTEALERKIEELENKLDASRADVSGNVSSSAEIKPVPEVKKTTSVPVVAPLNTKTKVVPEKVMVPEVKTEEKVVPPPVVIPSVTFDVVRSTQTIFEETQTTYGYGGFEVGIEVFANKDDVFIPMTTTDSTNGLTGFSYSVKGDPFRGSQNSKISCGLKFGAYCKIKAGSSSVITATVWLTPNQSGNYGVRFDKFKAKVGQDGVFQSYDLGEETERIYLSY